MIWSVGKPIRILATGIAIDPMTDRLNTLGYRIGTRVLELMAWRAESSSKTPKREIRFLPALMSIHTQVWKAVFGKPADAIEKSVSNDDECTLIIVMLVSCSDCTADMIIDNEPSIERYISVPRDMSQLSCSSFTAGIVEAVLDGLGFVSRSVSCVLCCFAYTGVILACPSDGTQYTRSRTSISDHYSHKTRKICT